MEIQPPVTTPAEPRRTRLGRQRQIVAALSRQRFGVLVQRSPMPQPGRGRFAGSPKWLRAAR
jgi:hypothetical protein